MREEVLGGLKKMHDGLHNILLGSSNQV